MGKHDVMRIELRVAGRRPQSRPRHVALHPKRPVKPAAEPFAVPGVHRLRPAYATKPCLGRWVARADHGGPRHPVGAMAVHPHVLLETVALGLETAKHLLALGASLKTAIQYGVSRKRSEPTLTLRNGYGECATLQERVVPSSRPAVWSGSGVWCAALRSWRHV